MVTFQQQLGFVGFFFFRLSDECVLFKRSLVRKPFQVSCGNLIRVDSDYGTLQIRVKC